MFIYLCVFEEIFPYETFAEYGRKNKSFSPELCWTTPIISRKHSTISYFLDITLQMDYSKQSFDKSFRSFRYNLLPFEEILEITVQINRFKQSLVKICWSYRGNLSPLSIAHKSNGKCIILIKVLSNYCNDSKEISHYRAPL